MVYESKNNVETGQAPNLNDYSRYPTILRRYLATAIDGILVLIAFFVFTALFSGQQTFATAARIGTILLLLLVYEPFCTSKLFTIGQWITHIRVRSYEEIKQISLPKVYLRILVKVFLGWVSLVTIPLTKGRRGIHDFAAGSIVISAEKSKTS